GAFGAARVPARPDRPDGLVGDHEAGARERRWVMRPDGAPQLALDERLGRGRATFPDLEQLADAEDRPNPPPDPPPELLGDPLVRLGVVAPPLAVADDHPRREAGEHRGGDVAGERAPDHMEDVLV